MRAVLYLRVSTNRQETENQRRDLLAAAEERGWAVVAEYADNGVSGAASRKPNLERLLEDAEAGKFDVVMFWALDRLTRKGIFDALRILYRLTQSGVKFYSHKESFLDGFGEFQDLMVAFFAKLAELERRRISERVKAGLARTRAQGTRLGRPPVQFDKSRARQLRRRGYTYRQIAAEMGVSVATVHRALAS